MCSKNLTGLLIPTPNLPYWHVNWNLWRTIPTINIFTTKLREALEQGPVYFWFKSPNTHDKNISWTWWSLHYWVLLNGMTCYRIMKPVTRTIVCENTSIWIMWNNQRGFCQEQIMLKICSVFIYSPPVVLQRPFVRPMAVQKLSSVLSFIHIHIHICIISKHLFTFAGATRIMAEEQANEE